MLVCRELKEKPVFNTCIQSYYCRPKEDEDGIDGWTNGGIDFVVLGLEAEKVGCRRNNLGVLRRILG
jgi:hypothetical protein